MYILGIFDGIKDFFVSIKNFFWSNYDNPILWIAICAIVLSIFSVAYTILHGRD